jgi:hypothetical protein
MKRAFIVCGPPCSGNRLVGAILVRAGCWGEGSTNQPKCISEIPSNAQNIVWIHPSHLERIPDSLRSVGFDEITFIVVIREPEANARSMVKSGFHETLEQAYQRRISDIGNSISVALTNNCKIEIITYEGLSVPMLEIWLTKLGLPINNLEDPLLLVGQFAANVITNENGKHY